LLPLPAAKVRNLSLENHLALAATRSGNGTADQMSCLLKTVYLAYFLRDAQHADPDFDPLHVYETALEVSAVDGVKQEVRFTDKHLRRSAEVIVAASGGHGCRSSWQYS
jgi:hypothetical protein